MYKNFSSTLPLTSIHSCSLTHHKLYSVEALIMFSILYLCLSRLQVLDLYVHFCSTFCCCGHPAGIVYVCVEMSAGTSCWCFCWRPQSQPWLKETAPVEKTGRAAGQREWKPNGSPALMTSRWKEKLWITGYWNSSTHQHLAQVLMRLSGQTLKLFKGDCYT